MIRYMFSIFLAASLLALAPAGVGAPRDGAVDQEFVAQLQKRGYEFAGARDGVSVYKHRGSGAIKFVSVGVLPAPPDAVLHALLDYEHQKKYISRLSDIEVLERGANHVVVYQRLNLPIISDRDFTLDVRWKKTGKSAWVAYEVAPDKGPAPKDGVVRLSVHSGKWQVLPGPEPGTTLLRFHVTIDLGGSLPKALARAGAGRDVPDLYEGICELAVGPEEGAERCP